MFVAASTDCFRELSYDDCIEKLVDLEFSSVELSIDETGNHIRPSEVVADMEKAIAKCQSTRRLTVAGYNLVVDQFDDAYLSTFETCCKLAKATRVVTLSVESGEHGTPFNEEVERFKSLVTIAEKYGIRVGMRSQNGRLSADPDTVSVICGHVKGLGLALDPTHYVYGQDRELNYEKLLQYVQTVYLRDSTKDDIQVRVG
ncbi:MAG: TIM barrel protein, partial [Planctomycetota bacterium]